MDVKTLVDQFAEASRIADDAKRRVERLQVELDSHIKVGAELEGHKYRIRKRDRRVLRPERLQQAIPVSMWRRITKRVPVAALYKAEIERGRLTEQQLDDCSDRSRTWLEVL